MAGPSSSRSTHEPRNVSHNNAMNLTNRGVPGMKERRPSGEPELAEVGPPIILSLGIAGYCSVSGPWGAQA